MSLPRGALLCASFWAALSTAGAQAGSRKYSNSTDKVEAATNAAWTFTSSTGGTVSFWFYLTSSPATRKFLLAADDGNTVDSGWWIDTGPDGTLFVRWIIEYNSSNLIARTSTSPATGRWNHIVMTWSGGTNPSSSVGFYLNGGDRELAGPSTGGTTHGTTSQPLAIGHENANRATNNSIPGYISDVAIFSGVLPLAALKQLAAGFDPRRVGTGLKAYFPLAGVGLAEYDSAAQNHAKTISGTTPGTTPPLLVPLMPSYSGKVPAAAAFKPRRLLLGVGG